MTLTPSQTRILGMIRGATGRQVVDRSIVTGEIRAMHTPDLDTLLEAGLVEVRTMRLDVGRGVKLPVAGLYLTAAGRRCEVNALTDADRLADDEAAFQRAWKSEHEGLGYGGEQVTA